MRIVYSRETLAAGLVLFALLIALGTIGRGDEANSLGQVESTWPGVTLQLMKIQRVDGDHLLAALRITVTATAQNPTFIGNPPKAGWKDRQDLSAAQLTSGDYDPTPYSLTEAVMIDELTHQEYHALSDLPASPFWGPNALMTTLRPGNWIELAVEFATPPLPPVPPGQPPPKQTVTFVFPRATLPLKGITLPPPSEH